MKLADKNSNKRKLSAANAALFLLRDKPTFLKTALGRTVKLKKVVVVSDDAMFLPAVAEKQRVSFVSAGLGRVLVEHDDVFARLKSKIDNTDNALVVDMRWTSGNAEALRSLEQWGNAAERLSQELQRVIVSIYDHDLLIEEHMQVALRVHSKFLAASGIYENPFWLPAKLLNSAALDEQLAFLLGRVVPDHQDLQQRRKTGEMLAQGATPSWLSKRDLVLGAGSPLTQWQIHCFGQLRVSIAGRHIEWRIAGSTPKKTQTLFAYLLQSGEKGAHSEQISELLWPDEADDSIKRARLHHTVAMLRKTLGLAQSIIRAGDYYRLNAPAGSWIDINTFEQQCRRGLALFKKNEFESALQVYLAADQLYAGDLFENLSRDYVESENENWCLPRRMWLREMALKLQNDLTRLLLQLGRTREALDHCLKALSIDPASEGANEAAMGIFAIQGREDAIHRQFKQYQQATKALGEIESVELRAHYRALVSKEKPKNGD